MTPVTEPVVSLFHAFVVLHILFGSLGLVAFWIPVLSASLACITAILGQGVLTRASAGRTQPAPAVSWNTDPLPGPTPGGIVDDPDAAR